MKNTLTLLALFISSSMAFMSCTTEVEGTVKLIGNAPFEKLIVVMADNKTMEIVGPLVDELRQLVGNKVVLSGILSTAQGIPGFPPSFKATAILKRH